MPLPRKKDEGTAAPVLNILQAHAKLFDVEEHTKPYTVTRKSDGAQFELDPGFNCTVEIVDDGENGDHNGERFFESFKYKKNSDGKRRSRSPRLRREGRPAPSFTASQPLVRASLNSKRAATGLQNASSATSTLVEGGEGQVTVFLSISISLWTASRGATNITGTSFISLN